MGFMDETFSKAFGRSGVAGSAFARRLCEAENL